MSASSVCSILDMPDEILVMIILHFDARERLALANSCQRFNDLVFGDKELLRNLDFTREGDLTKDSDVEQYFNNENTYKKIVGINIKHLRRVSISRSLIVKARNLVELNILDAFFFQSVEELSCLLKPLVHLKRLSVSWPDLEISYDDPERNQVLEEPLSRLTYLSVQSECYSKKFLLIVQLCQQLERLHMMVSFDAFDGERELRREPMKVGSLKSVQLFGDEYFGPLANDFMCIIPNPAQWTDFSLVDSSYNVYLERNVEVCAELAQVKEMPLPDYIENFRDTFLIDEGWPLVPELLLSEVMKVTHEDVPEKCCCLSFSQYSSYQSCLRLQIDEAKKLLKDPGYQISYLRFSHVIEKNCDMHLVASAFPNLTTLVLSGISWRNSPEKTEPLYRRLRRKGSLTPEETSDARNMDSSFGMLVENTPRLKVLEISPDIRENIMKYWDLDALYLISGWKNLTVIRLYNVPITDGEFLIGIGKECTKLEEVVLRNLSPDEACSCESELFQMLQRCENLRKLAIGVTSLNHVPEMFDILSNCLRLENLDLEIIIGHCYLSELKSSVEKMLRQCLEFKQFSIYLHDYEFCAALRCHVKRCRNKCVTGCPCCKAGLKCSIICSNCSGHACENQPDIIDILNDNDNDIDNGKGEEIHGQNAAEEYEVVEDRVTEIEENQPTSSKKMRRE